MNTLLDINADLLSFKQLLDDSLDGGELLAETEAALDAWFAELAHNRDEKVDSYCALVRSCELRAAARREEMDRLQMRVTVDEALAKRLKARLQFFFDAQGLKKIETLRYAVSVQANGGLQALEVGCRPEELPAAFQKVTIAANTEAIREAFKSGVTVPGCKILERGRHLRIR